MYGSHSGAKSKAEMASFDEYIKAADPRLNISMTTSLISSCKERGRGKMV